MIGCHVVGERAVEIAQVAAVAIAAAMPVEQFVRIPLSFPTYTNVFGAGGTRCRTPARRTRLLGRPRARRPQRLTPTTARPGRPGLFRAGRRCWPCFKGAKRRRPRLRDPR